MMVEDEHALSVEGKVGHDKIYVSRANNYFASGTGGGSANNR
jgi:hypothetical protein